MTSVQSINFSSSLRLQVILDLFGHLPNKTKTADHKEHGIPSDIINILSAEVIEETNSNAASGKEGCISRCRCS